MAAFAEKEALDSQNMGLFGEPEPVSIKDAINYAVKVIEDNYGDNANLSMFDSATQEFEAIEKRYFLGHLLHKFGWRKEDSDKNVYIRKNINGARKIVFKMNENQDDFIIEIVESGGDFVAEIGNCINKKISEIFEFMNGFLLDEQQIDSEVISAFDSIFTDNSWFDYLFQNNGSKAKTNFTTFDQKAHEAATSPLNDLDFPNNEQKQTGEYQKGHFSIGDLKIAIENPAGSIRSGTDPNGNEWQITMKHHYGFIENTTGADGDEIDVFVKNHLANDPEYAYIIKQLDSNGQFDEQKVIIGAETEEEAKEIYLSNYEKGWQGFGGIKKISMADLLKKIQHTWSEFDSWAVDGSYEHIPLDHVITENAPKIHESKISREDPIVVIEKLGKYYLIAGLDRIELAKKRDEKFIPAIIFDDKEVKASIIQKAIKQAGTKVDPVALAALIVDELEKSLVHSFDDVPNSFLDILYKA